MTNTVDRLIHTANRHINLIKIKIICSKSLYEQNNAAHELLQTLTWLEDESLELPRCKRSEFQSNIKIHLKEILSLNLELDKIEAVTIKLLAFSTVMQFIAKMADYKYLFQENFSNWLNILQFIFSIKKYKADQIIKKHTWVAFTCFCHIMQTQTQLLYIEYRFKYYLFLHDEIAIEEIIQNAYQLKDTPELSNYAVSSLHETIYTYTSIRLTQSILDELSTPEDKRYFSELLKDLKDFIQYHTRNFIKQALKNITSQHHYLQFSRLYSSLSQKPPLSSAGWSQLQRYLAQILSEDINLPRHQGEMPLYFYATLSRDTTWQHIAYEQIIKMKPHVCKTITKSSGYHSWEHEVMRQSLYKPRLFHTPEHITIQSSRLSPEILPLKMDL